MKIAVLIPVYNAGRYLKECLDSVLAQSLRDFEVFACDDGSTDGGYGILEAYSAANPQVHISRHANAGVSATRNELLDNLPSDIDAVCFVDSDDLIAPTMLEALAGALERSGADVAECGITHDRAALYAGEAAAIPETVSDNMRAGSWINIVNKLYRRAVVGDIRFRKGLAFEEDNFFNREVNRIAKMKVMLGAAMYYYRDNPASATGALDCGKYASSVTERVRLTLEIFGPSAELAKDAYRMMIRKNLKKNKNAAQRRELFLAAGAALRRFEREYGFRPKGLNPIQHLLFRCCQRGCYLSAMLLVQLT